MSRISRVFPQSRNQSRRQVCHAGGTKYRQCLQSCLGFGNEARHIKSPADRPYPAQITGSARQQRNRSIEIPFPPVVECRGYLQNSLVEIPHFARLCYPQFLKGLMTFQPVMLIEFDHCPEQFRARRPCTAPHLQPSPVIRDTSSKHAIFLILRPLYCRFEIARLLMVHSSYGSFVRGASGACSSSDCRYLTQPLVYSGHSGTTGTGSVFSGSHRYIQGRLRAAGRC